MLKVTTFIDKYKGLFNLIWWKTRFFPLKVKIFHYISSKLHQMIPYRQCMISGSDPNDSLCMAPKAKNHKSRSQLAPSPIFTPNIKKGKIQ